MDGEVSTENLEEQKSRDSEEFHLTAERFEDDQDDGWMERTGLDRDTLCAAVETLIFMSDRPLSFGRMKKALEIPEKALAEAVADLRKSYARSRHGLELVEVAGGFQFRTKGEYAKHIQNLYRVQSVMLSPTAMEVLAIIAYRQPISKIQIDEIRGVDSSYIVRGLMDKNLVKARGRSGEMGRSILYGTTSEFLELFNLASLDQLPPEHELQEMAGDEVGDISDIREFVSAGGKEAFNRDEIEELDNLKSRIKRVNVDTDFTRALKNLSKEKAAASAKGAPEGSPEGSPKSAFDLLGEYAGEGDVTESMAEVKAMESRLEPEDDDNR